VARVSTLSDEVSSARESHGKGLGLSMAKRTRRAGAHKKSEGSVREATTVNTEVAEVAAVSAEIAARSVKIDAIFEPDVYINDRGLYSKDEITARALQPVHNHRDVLETKNYKTEIDNLLKENQSWADKVFDLNPK
jgi:hypothetical protein